MTYLFMDSAVGAGKVNVFMRFLELTLYITFSHNKCKSVGQPVLWLQGVHGKRQSPLADVYGREARTGRERGRIGESL